jgi:hypothetical protein
MVRIIKVLRVLLAGWSFRGQRAKGKGHGKGHKRQKTHEKTGTVGRRVFRLCSLLAPPHSVFFVPGFWI